MCLKDYIQASKAQQYQNSAKYAKKKGTEFDNKTPEGVLSNLMGLSNNKNQCIF